MIKIEISDSCVAVQNPAHIRSGGRWKREKINPFDTIFFLIVTFLRGNPEKKVSKQPLVPDE
jgi:hypothetical protein